MSAPYNSMPQQGSYPPQQGGYPPQQGGYPPQQGGYPPQQGGAGAPPAQTEPSAPPSFDNISGYEKATGFDFAPAGPPPAYQPTGQPEERPQEHFNQAAQITDAQAKDALVEFVSQNCCYGASPANDMEIKDMKSSSAYHYKLESFTETRTFNWHQEPYIGQPIDGPHNGPAPHAWQMQVTQPAPFQPTVIYMEIPHTASVKTCNYCSGKGHKKCKHCHGDGRTRCTSCGGDGHVHRAEGHEECVFCHGHGHKECHHCHGRGKITCPTCQGHGKVKTYLRLKVEWEIKRSDHVVERTDLPDELIKNVSGAQLFAQEFPRVFPLTSFYEPEINQASQNIVNTHANYANTSIIHLQRHDLRAVPVNEVHCVWKDKPYRFWVYGMEHKVHCPDYPQQCCCGCTIL
eukprot:Seg7057.1 transcript_id=Seg7057.1/GoldUCD/mRNA.D3Y31 product="Protein SSUH2" protein_id=Seg7057.1/GoldUCD/D3Y31